MTMRASCHKRLLALIQATLIGLPSATANADESFAVVNQAIQDHGRLMADGDAEGAIELLTERLEQFPDEERLLNARASAYLDAKRYADAIADFERASVEGQRNWFNAQSSLAYLLTNAEDESFRDPERAVRLYDEVMRRGYYRDNWGHLQELSKACHAAGDLEGAISAQQRALEVANEGVYVKVFERLANLKKQRPDEEREWSTVSFCVADEEGNLLEGAWVGVQYGSIGSGTAAGRFDTQVRTGAAGWCVCEVAYAPAERLHNFSTRVEVLENAARERLWVPRDWGGVLSGGGGAMHGAPNAAKITGLGGEPIRQVLLKTSGAGEVRLMAGFFQGVANPAFSERLAAAGYERLDERSYRVTLREAGKVRGRVVSDDPEAPLSRAFLLRTRPDEHRVAYGVAEVTPDASGSFEVGKLMDGWLQADFRPDPADPWRASIAPDLGVRSSTTTELTVNVERGVLVQGRLTPIRFDEEEESAKPSRVSFRWGATLANAGPPFDAFTVPVDKDGGYRVYLPAGEAEVTAWFLRSDYQLSSLQTRLVVPAKASDYSLTAPKTMERSPSRGSGGWVRGQ